MSNTPTPSATAALGAAAASAHPTNYAWIAGVIIGGIVAVAVMIAIWYYMRHAPPSLSLPSFDAKPVNPPPSGAGSVVSSQERSLSFRDNPMMEEPRPKGTSVSARSAAYSETDFDYYRGTPAARGKGDGTSRKRGSDDNISSYADVRSPRGEPHAPAVPNGGLTPRSHATDLSTDVALCVAQAALEFAAHLADESDDDEVEEHVRAIEPAAASVSSVVVPVAATSTTAEHARGSAPADAAVVIVAPGAPSPFHDKGAAVTVEGKASSPSTTPPLVMHPTHVADELHLEQPRDHSFPANAGLTVPATQQPPVVATELLVSNSDAGPATATDATQPIDASGEASRKRSVSIPRGTGNSHAAQRPPVVSTISSASASSTAAGGAPPKGTRKITIPAIFTSDGVGAPLPLGGGGSTPSPSSAFPVPIVSPSGGHAPLLPSTSSRKLSGRSDAPTPNGSASSRNSLPIPADSHRGRLK